MQPLRFVVIGLGGFAQAHLEAVAWLEQQNLARLEGVVALASDRQQFPERVAELEARHVTFFENIDDFLDHGASRADVLTVPIGIHQHVPVSVAALQAGLHIYCEKPVAGTIQEVDRLIQVQQRTGKHVAIGFQHLFAPVMQQLKQRICEGRLGLPKKATLVNGWPRSLEYFRRNDWAGKMRVGNQWILDSPANNAMAHYLMNLLYLASTTPNHAAAPVWVQAELYRANPVESTDTVQLHFETDSGMQAHVILTHATSRDVGPEMHLKFEKGEIHWQSHEGRATVSYANGPTEHFDNGSGSWRFEGFRNLANAILTGAPLLCTPEIARTHTLTINAMHESCPHIWAVPGQALVQEEDWRIWPPNTRGHFYRIRHLEHWIERAIAEEQFFSDLQIPWARAGKKFWVVNYALFPRPDGEFAKAFTKEGDRSQSPPG